jgi:pyrimidine-nucleoside phosphorylase
MTEPWLRRAIETKRDGGNLDAATWRRIVEDGVAGRIDEAPLGALLMAAAIRGLSPEETQGLTEAMVRSGDVLAFDGPVIDKHSSGGVGDAVSLVAVPLVAACGVRIAKLSGRALEHTGGTLDKLESIPGVRTDLSPDEFRAQLGRIGCAIVAQTARLAPADKIFYDLRDRTGTVRCTGLIASSIVSKKIAGGASAVVFDVKTGAGAFMRTVAEARELAEMLVALCERFGRRASALVTDMNEPLAPAIGTALEAIEARDFLAGTRRDPRFAEVVMLVATEMLRVGGVDEPEPRLRGALEDGTAYERFVALIEAQGGTRAALEAMQLPAERTPVLAPSDGYVSAIDTVALGRAARDLVERSGPRAGILVRARLGNAMRRGDTLAEIVGAPTATAPASFFTLAGSPLEPPPILCALVRDAEGARPSNRTPA